MRIYPRVPVERMAKPFWYRKKVHGWQRATIPKIIIHIKVGSRYCLLNILNFQKITVIRK
ncbi:MAG: hypothetical protein V3U04_09630 [Candidatus Aerophobetes bacterium]